MFPDTAAQGVGGSADAALAGSGHRARLRDRLLGGGPEALADYEVLEYLLFGANARGDTKPQANALLARFGSLAGVLNAEPQALKQVKGISDAGVGAIKIAALAARRMARSQVQQEPILASWQALMDYLAIDMAHLTHERVRVLYLNTRNRLLLDHLVHDGTVDEASIHPREVIKRGLDIGASALILVHNHPSGNPEPSRADIQVTHRIAEAGQLLGITVHDHVIVGRNSQVSLRAKGLL
jgi:DNA repair protein RadC